MWYGYEAAHRHIVEVVNELPSAQRKIESILDNKVHLCSSCQYTYPTCPEHGNDVVFGDGIGNDNICACAKYKPSTRRIGRWKAVNGYVTPGGTPYYECGACGGSGHLHGAEYPERKVICDNCGRINVYPWEKTYECGSSFWEDDNE